MPKRMLFTLLTEILLLASLPVGASMQPASLSVVSRTDQPEQTLLIIADNQEHLLTGAPLPEMGSRANRLVTSVALRSPLANVGGRLLMREALRFGQSQGAGLVLHLGDAADISCPNELSAAFDTLDREAPGIWFMTPGNHDGLLAGNFAADRSLLGSAPRDPRSVYTRTPRQGLEGPRSWLNACLSPSNLASPDILMRSDAIRLYVDRLKSRPGVSPRQLAPEQIRISGTDITCKVEEIKIPSQGYTAIARICPRARRRRDTTWIGPSASYIVQSLDVGGTRIVLLDTSDYRDPRTRDVALRGTLSEEQRRQAAVFFQSFARENVIVAGHHPLADLPRDQQRWVMEKSGRYISAHVHTSASLIPHLANGKRTMELNIGSTLDYPPQAVIAKIAPTGMKFRVAGADVSKTQWPGFLEQCETKRKAWTLPNRTVYTNYTGGNYVMHLLESLRQAAAVAPSGPRLVIPTGTEVGDWLLLERALQEINTADGESGMFWACQAYYASDATRQERASLERLRSRLGLDSRPGNDATGTEPGGTWHRFSSP